MNKEENKKENKDEKVEIKIDISNEKAKEKEEIDYKAKFEEVQKQLIQANLKNVELKVENEKNILDFQEKAKGFAAKAQEEVNRIKQENNKKLEEERDHIKKYGSQKMLEAILEPLINIELAVKAGKNNEAVSAYVIGFEMLLGQLYNELSSFGVVKIEPSVGDEFDAHLHYAISTIEGKNKNKISQVKKVGFKLHDRVIKPATVVIEV